MGLLAYQLLRKGGRFLGAARSWIQWHKNNGSDVTWGSSDVLQPPMTVKEVEELAADVASAHEAERLEECHHALKLAERALKGIILNPYDTEKDWDIRVAIREIERELRGREDDRNS